MAQSEPQSAAPRRAADDSMMRMALPVGRSVWAIVAGYLGLFALLVYPAPLALLVSIVAVLDIRKSTRGDGPVKYGMGRAVFGLVVGGLGTCLLLYLRLRSALAE